MCLDSRSSGKPNSPGLNVNTLETHQLFALAHFVTDSRHISPSTPALPQRTAGCLPPAAVSSGGGVEAAVPTTVRVK